MSSPSTVSLIVAPTTRPLLIEFESPLLLTSSAAWVYHPPISPPTLANLTQALRRLTPPAALWIDTDSLAANWNFGNRSVRTSVRDQAGFESVLEMMGERGGIDHFVVKVRVGGWRGMVVLLMEGLDMEEVRGGEVVIDVPERIEPVEGDVRLEPLPQAEEDGYDADESSNIDDGSEGRDEVENDITSLNVDANLESIARDGDGPSPYRAVSLQATTAIDTARSHEDENGPFFDVPLSGDDLVDGRANPTSQPPQTNTAAKLAAIAHMPGVGPEMNTAGKSGAGEDKGHQSGEF